MKKLPPVLILPLCLAVLRAAVSIAQDIVALDNDYLTFPNSDSALYYCIGSAPKLDDTNTWNGYHAGWKHIHTNQPTVTVPIGTFYRVVGTTNPIDVGTAEGEARPTWVK